MLGGSTYFDHYESAHFAGKKLFLVFVRTVSLVAWKFVNLQNKVALIA